MWCASGHLSVQFTHSVMSHSLRLHELQHARLPCSSTAPRACSNSCPSSWWCHLTISSSVSFSSCLPSFPASGSFPMSQFLTSGGQSVGASASVLPMYIQSWFPLGLTGLILQSKGLSRVFSNTTVQKHQFFSAHLSLWPNSHIHTGLQEKNIALTKWTFVGKVMSLLFNMLSRFFFAFLPRSKRLFSFHGGSHHPQWFSSPRKWSLSLFPFFPHLLWSDGTGCHDLLFLNVEF